MTNQVLTIREANRLARGRARATADPVDPRLWWVEGDGWVEAHEPMTRLAWQTFLAEKVDAEKPTRRSRRHEMVAYSGEQTALLRDVLRDALSPQAVAAMATYLLAGKTANKKVACEMMWFTNLLVMDVLGGPEALDRLVEEAGP